MKRPYTQYEVIDAIRRRLNLLLPAIRERIIWPNGTTDKEALKGLLLRMNAAADDSPDGDILRWFSALSDKRKAPYINVVIENSNAELQTTLS